MPAAGQTDVGDRAGRGLARQQGVAGVGGDALGGVHGHRVPQMGVLAQVIARQDRDRAVVDAPRRDPPHIGVDGEDLPALTVANRSASAPRSVRVEMSTVFCRVITTSPTATRCPRAAATVGTSSPIRSEVDADVERIGHLPPIGDQQTVTVATTSARQAATASSAMVT